MLKSFTKDKDIALEAAKQGKGVLNFFDISLQNDPLFSKICDKIKTIEKDGLTTVLNNIVTESNIEQRENLTKSFKNIIDEIKNKKYKNYILQDHEPFSNASKTLIDNNKSQTKFRDMSQNKYNNTKQR